MYRSNIPINKIYAIGGLEENEDDFKIMNVDGTDYVIGDKFRFMLQDLILDWDTFLEIYNKNMEYSDIFEQVVKILNIKDNQSLRDTLLQVVDQIYKLSPETHLICMLKQFLIYEPLSISVHSLFNTIKNHYENIFKLFIETRNKYINNNKLKAKLNNWKERLDEWNELNMNNNLDSSSVILLFLNPPRGLKNNLFIKIPNLEEKSNNLISAIKKFKYPGFCPKVPNKRLKGLLKFPLKEFVDIIYSMDSSIKFPDYNTIEQKIENILHENKETKPVIDIQFKLEEPPANLVERANADDTSDSSNEFKFQLLKWYVSRILEMRKALLPYGKKYELYYENMAKKIALINTVIKQGINIL